MRASLPALSNRAGLVHVGYTKGHGETTHGAGFVLVSSVIKTAERMIQDVS